MEAPEDLLALTTSQLAEFLSEGTTVSPRGIELLVTNQFTGATFVTVTDEELMAVGIKTQDRRDICKVIQQGNRKIHLNSC